MSKRNLKRRQSGEDIENVPPKKTRRVVFRIPIPRRLNVVGRALVCGQGDMGQLGLGTDERDWERLHLSQVPNVIDVVDVLAGGMHTLLLTKTGKLYSFGCNDEGALGRDTHADDEAEFLACQVVLPGRVVKMSAGDSHSACLLSDGRVFAWGSFRDSNGAMGFTYKSKEPFPKHILTGHVCCDVSSGVDHLLILKRNGKVYSFGCGEQGQLGRLPPNSCKERMLTPGELLLPSGSLVDAIWATSHCSFLREKDTGNIWSCGLNNYKQTACATVEQLVHFPINTGIRNVKQIAGGMHHTVFLMSDGSCSAIGRHEYGRLGMGPMDKDTDELLPIASPCGTKVQYIACGPALSFAIGERGEVYGWGMGTSFQLATGTDEDVQEPLEVKAKGVHNKRVLRVSAGGQHTVFLVEWNN